MDSLTPRQRGLLGFIRTHTTRKGWAPTIREMCAHFGWASTHTAALHLDALEAKGAITRLRGTARAIRVTSAGRGAP